MPKRTRMAIKDAFRSAMDLEGLRTALNLIPNIAGSNLRMDNRVQMKGDRFLITDFVVEVDDTFADQVRKAIQDSGFELRGNPLFGRPEVLQAVRDLVEAHRRDNAETQLKYAIWFRLEDPQDVHLLEIADGVFDPGDASLEGFRLSAGDAVPGARSIVVYLASPDEFRKACGANEGHPAVVAVREKRCELVFPDDAWEAFTEEFPQAVSNAAV
jgi:hypothetical protein